MNNVVEDYLKEKYGEDYQKKAEDKYADQSNNISAGSFASSLGDALAGRAPGSQNAYFDSMKKQAKEDTLGKIETQKKDYIASGAFENQQKEAQRKSDQFDPNSNSSQSFRKIIEAQYPDLVKTYGDSWGKVSAGDQENIFKPLQLKEQTDARKQTAQILTGERRDKKEDREKEKNEGLATPYGLANTVDDAKQLKEAHEAKKNFDNKIEQMIALRTENKGGALFDREAVARGKQLSKDLLLEYKNMAKLGVLSKSDEDIINAIIPADPLEYNSPVAAIQGQDPVLKKLTSFQSDSNKDFANRIQTRTRAGIAQTMQQPQKESDVEQYANAHGISYDQAMQIKQQRTSKQAGR